MFGLVANQAQIPHSHLHALVLQPQVTHIYSTCLPYPLGPPRPFIKQNNEMVSEDHGGKIHQISVARSQR